MGTHPIFESDFDCLTEFGRSGRFVFDILHHCTSLTFIPLSSLQKFGLSALETLGKVNNKSEMNQTEETDAVTVRNTRTDHIGSAIIGIISTCVLLGCLLLKYRFTAEQQRQKQKATSDPPVDQPPTYDEVMNGQSSVQTISSRVL